MKLIEANELLLAALEADALVANVTLQDLRHRYEQVSEAFHSHFAWGSTQHHENAIFHKIRYLDLLSRRWQGRVLDVGNDKPFLSYFLKRFNPGAEFETISNEIPETPFTLHEVDIECDRFPFDDEHFDQVIFTEVIEHLWRNPSHCVFEINRVLKPSGLLYLTTPNPCDRHSLVCVLWQANPNQRSGYYATLESGHLHLWTVKDVQVLLQAHGFDIVSATTADLYGHTRDDENVERFIREITPHRDLMNETVVVHAHKVSTPGAPAYPAEIFPDGCPVQFAGAIVGFSRCTRPTN